MSISGFSKDFFADEGGSFVDIHLYYTGCPISVCAIWKIDLISSRYIGIYFVLIRPPSCLAVSRSYPWHLMKWIISSLFSYVSVFKKKMQLYFAHLSFLYFKKTQLFFTGIFSFAFRNPQESGYLCCYQLNYPADNCSVMPPVIWSFPVWLSISSSYPMTVFRANLFGCFYGEIF